MGFAHKINRNNIKSVCDDNCNDLQHHLLLTQSCFIFIWIWTRKKNRNDLQWIYFHIFIEILKNERIFSTSLLLSRQIMKNNHFSISVDSNQNKNFPLISQIGFHFTQFHENKHINFNAHSCFYRLHSSVLSDFFVLNDNFE